MRIHLDESTPEQRSVSHDLAAIERLIERCERELSDTDLNIKLTDYVRLLEFRAKLKPAVDAEKTFWSMIHDMRREELTNWNNSRTTVSSD
jgi:hypothetical protein